MIKKIKYALTARRNIGTKKKPEWEEYAGFECSIPWSELAEEIAKKEAYNGEYTIVEVDDEEFPTASPTLESRMTTLEESQKKISDALTQILQKLSGIEMLKED